MWNRWTSSASALSLTAAASLGAPPAVEFVDYAWMVLEDGRETFNQNLPGNTDWDAAVVVAPIEPFSEQNSGLLTFVSGDVIPGELLGVTENANELTIVWESGRLGEYRVPIEAVAAIALSPASESDSQVILRNGDMLNGSLEVTELGIRVGEIPDNFDVPWERVASLRLNDTVNTGDGLRVWLRNGGVIGIESSEQRPGGFFLRTREGRGGLYHSGEVLAMTRGAFRIRSIGSPLHADDSIDANGTGLIARGRSIARWELTGDEIGLVGIARTPDDSVEWGDALVSAWAGNEIVFSSRTNKERPAVAIGAPLPGEPGTLTLSIQPGTAGTANGVMEISLAVIERVEPRDE